MEKAVLIDLSAAFRLPGAKHLKVILDNRCFIS